MKINFLSAIACLMLLLVASVERANAQNFDLLLMQVETNGHWYDRKAFANYRSKYCGPTDAFFQSRYHGDPAEIAADVSRLKGMSVQTKVKYFVARGVPQECILRLVRHDQKLATATDIVILATVDIVVRDGDRPAMEWPDMRRNTFALDYWGLQDPRNPKDVLPLVNTEPPSS